MVIFSPGWFRLPASCLATPAFLVIAGGSEKTSVYSIQVCVYSEGKINQSEHCCLPCNFSWCQLRDQIVDFFKQTLEKATGLETSHRMMMTEKVVNKGSLLQARSHTEVRESNNVLQPSCYNNHCKYLTLNEENSRQVFGILEKGSRKDVKSVLDEKEVSLGMIDPTSGRSKTSSKIFNPNPLNWRHHIVHSSL